jgi:formiminotetrahydrofolate cyclodeaminase
MEAALREACAAPLKTMEKCCEVLDLLEEIAMKGALLALSDAGCGAAMCKAGLLSAYLNVLINTKYMADRGHAADVNDKAAGFLARAGKADEIYNSVAKRLQS